MYAVDVITQGIELKLNPSCDPSCFQCQNCEIVNAGQEDEFWCCETYGWGVPCSCSPPHDDPCDMFNTDERFDNSVLVEMVERIKAYMND